MKNKIIHTRKIGKHTLNGYSGHLRSFIVTSDTIDIILKQDRTVHNRITNNRSIDKEIEDMINRYESIITELIKEEEERKEYFKAQSRKAIIIEDDSPWWKFW